MSDSEENNKNQLAVVKNNYLAKVSSTLSITNKLLNEIDNREPSDDFRVAIPDENFQRYLSEELGIDVNEGTVAYGDVKDVTEVKIIGSKYLSIKRLEGIEFFNSLKSIICNDIGLNFLDISKNINLRYKSKIIHPNYTIKILFFFLWACPRLVVSSLQNNLC